MCIISGSVNTVAKTKIMVAPTKDNRQLTVYCNKVSFDSPSGTMILPFPYSPCEFIDLTNYKELFGDLRKIWPTPRSKGRGGPFYFGGIEVTQVGSYLASIAPRIEDFSKLSDTFVISPQVLEFVAKHYPVDYSFVVCKLDKQKEYHPFGFCHGKLTNKQMFIPTMHFHEQQQNDEVKLPDTPNFRGSEDNSSRSRVLVRAARRWGPDWDHEIYTMNSSVSSLHNAWSHQTTKSPLVDFTKLPSVLSDFQDWSAIKITPENFYQRNHDLAASGRFRSVR